MKISLELLYHYQCEHCNKWWSVADITPTPGKIVCCPHCGHESEIPNGITTGDGTVITWNSDKARFT